MRNHGSLSLIILLLCSSCFAGQQEAFPHGLWASLKSNMSLVLSAQRDLIPLQHRADAQSSRWILPASWCKGGVRRRGLSLPTPCKLGQGPRCSAPLIYISFPCPSLAPLQFEQHFLISSLFIMYSYVFFNKTRRLRVALLPHLMFGRTLGRTGWPQDWTAGQGHFRA